MELELEMEKEKEASKFATSAQSKLYQPAVALEFFKSAGKAENFAPGKSVFVESEGTASMFSEGARMYLLLDGEVTLSVGKEIIGTVAKGEVFGELASISQVPRIATVVARTACSLISLNEKQLQSALVKSPY